MPGRVLRPPARQGVPLDQLAGGRVEEDDRGLHAGEVQDLASVIGMRVHAAIRHDQRATVRHQVQVVRPDAVRVPLADPGKAVARVVEAQHAARVLVVVLGRDQEAAVGAEDAVAVEMPPLGRGEDMGAVAGRRDRQREGAGAPGEGDDPASVGAGGDVMAAAGQGQVVQDLAVAGQKGDAVALALDGGGGEDRSSLGTHPQG